jgi:hypothetical protein
MRSPAPRRPRRRCTSSPRQDDLFGAQRTVVPTRQDCVQLDDVHRAGLSGGRGRCRGTSSAQTRVGIDCVGGSDGGVCALRSVRGSRCPSWAGWISAGDRSLSATSAPTGQVCRGQIAPAGREQLRAWLARLAARDRIAFAVEGCAGWRCRRGAGRRRDHRASGRAGRHCGTAGEETAGQDRRAARADAAGRGRLPECWIPPARILEARALLGLYNDPRRERAAWAQRIHAALFRQGAPALGEGVAGMGAPAAAHLSPAGSCRSSSPWR